MKDQEVRLGEIAGLVSGILIGAMIIVVGRLLFDSGIAPLVFTEAAVWFRESYDPAATTVFIVSAIASASWYLISRRWWIKFKPREESTQATLIWLLLFALPIASMIFGVFFWGNDSGSSLQILSLIVFVLTFSLAIVSSYWVATAWSTPINMSHVIPLARLFRR